MIKLNINDLIVLENKIYRVEWSHFSNGKMQGNRAMLKLLRQEELNELLIKSTENQKNESIGTFIDEDSAMGKFIASPKNNVENTQ